MPAFEYEAERSDREIILGEGCAAADEAAEKLMESLAVGADDAAVVDELRMQFRDFVETFYLPLSQERCWSPGRLLRIVTAALAVELAAHQKLLETGAVRLALG